jgi:hypothetical protein
MYLREGMYGHEPVRIPTGRPATVTNGLGRTSTVSTGSVVPKIEVASAALAERLKTQPQDVHRLTARQFEQLIAEIKRWQQVPMQLNVRA